MLSSPRLPISSSGRRSSGVPPVEWPCEGVLEPSPARIRTLRRLTLEAPETSTHRRGHPPSGAERISVRLGEPWVGVEGRKGDAGDRHLRGRRHGGVLFCRWSVSELCPPWRCLACHTRPTHDGRALGEPGTPWSGPCESPPAWAVAQHGAALRVRSGCPGQPERTHSAPPNQLWIPRHWQRSAAHRRSSL